MLDGLFKMLRGRYDLPLNQTPGGGFVILLMGIITLLAVMTLSAGFALHSVASHWSAGLENKITIEIPSVDMDGNRRSDADINALIDSIKKDIQRFDSIIKIDVLDASYTQDLLEPWLGDDFVNEDVPLPTLIAVEAKATNPGFIETLHNRLIAISPDIHIDTHKEWLDDFLQLIGVLQFTVFFASALIAITAIVVIISAIRARIAEHRPDIELLHLMGAQDDYIVAQFVRYAARLSIAGGTCGLLGGGFLVMVFGLFVTPQSNQDLLPSISFSVFAMTVLLMLPITACVIGALSAKYTVLRSLARMP